MTDSPASLSAEKRAAYTDIIERLEKAEGPDREIDALIWIAIEYCGCRAVWQDGDLLAHERPGVQYLIGGIYHTPLGRTFQFNGHRAAPPYTADLNAIVDLIKRTLPLARGTVTFGPAKVHMAMLWERPRSPAWQKAIGATSEIALCLAFFRALSETKADQT